MNTESRCFLAPDLLLRQSIIEPTIIKPPMPQSIPLATRLRIESKAIVLFLPLLSNYWSAHDL